MDNLVDLDHDDRRDQQYFEKRAREADERCARTLTTFSLRMRHFVEGEEEPAHDRTFAFSLGKSCDVRVECSGQLSSFETTLGMLPSAVVMLPWRTYLVSLPAEDNDRGVYVLSELRFGALGDAVYHRWGDAAPVDKMMQSAVKVWSLGLVSLDSEDEQAWRNEERRQRTINARYQRKSTRITMTRAKLDDGCIPEQDSIATEFLLERVRSTTGCDYACITPLNTAQGSEVQHSPFYVNWAHLTQVVQLLLHRVRRGVPLGHRSKQAYTAPGCHMRTCVCARHEHDAISSAALQIVVRHVWGECDEVDEATASMVEMWKQAEFTWCARK